MAEMNRKAIFFSIVSILIILIFTAMTQIDVTVRESENDMSVSRTRVKTLNSMIDDMVNYYFDRLIYVAGKNAVVGLSEYYSENPSRIEDSLSDALASRVIYDAILEDGSDEINLSNYGGKEYVDPEYTLEGMKQSLTDAFRDNGIVIKTFDIRYISMSQEDAWNFKLTAGVDYHLSDEEGMVSWRGYVERTAYVSVYGVYLPGPDWEKVTEDWCERTYESSAYDKLGGISEHINGISMVCGGP